MQGVTCQKLKVMTVFGARAQRSFVVTRESKAGRMRIVINVLVHTGQNYDYEVETKFSFDDLSCANPTNFWKPWADRGRDIGQCDARKPTRSSSKFNPRCVFLC